MEEILLKKFDLFLGKNFKYAIVKKNDIAKNISNGSDIDILVDNINDSKRNVYSVFGHPMYELSRSYLISIFYDWGQIDLLDIIGWKGIEIFEKKNIFKNIEKDGFGHYVPVFYMDALIAWSQSILWAKKYNDQYTAKLRKALFLNKNEFDIFFIHCFGKKNLNRFNYFLINDKPEESYILATRLRIYIIIKQFLRSPIKFIYQILHYYSKELFIRINRILPIIALAGPDGVGKSTIVDIIINKKSHFPKYILCNNWRPNLLPRLRRFIGKAEKTFANGEQNLIIPRSNPGRFQFIRILYYLVDFIFGHYYKDKFDAARLTLIIYDRSIYDTLINPERFGLKNGFLTKMLVRFSPKPDILFYLSDSADRIYARKPELRIDEIKRQQKKWIELFLIKTNKIDLVIEINNTPNVIAEYLKFTYLRLWKQKFSPQQFYEDYLTSNYTFVVKDNDPIKLFRIHILKFKDGRIYFIPTLSNKIFKTSLSLYEAHTTLGKFYKNILLLLFPVKKYPIVLKKDGSKIQKFYLFIKDLVQDICVKQFGDGLNYAVSLGAPGPFQKPVVKVLGRRGDVFCYIKIGINQKTIDAVKNEVKWLTELGYLLDKGIEVPRIIFTQENENRFLFAQSSFEEVNGFKTETDLAKYMRHFQTLNQEKIKTEKFLNSQLSLSFTARINDICQEYLKNTLSIYFNRICTKLNDSEIHFSLNHGDFTPWNSRFNGDKIYLFDWEYSDDIHPVGWDLIRFLVQTSFHIEKINLLDLCKRFKIGGEYFIEVKKYLSGFELHSDDLIVSIIELYFFEQVLNACYFDIDNVQKLSNNLAMLYLYCNLIDELNL